jgi:aspartyl/asparaginyl beta-hydroxylase (cupin superfamily)
VKLDYHLFKSMANGFFGLFIGPKTRPTFFDIGKAFPELDLVTQAYPIIRKEFDRLIAEWNELPQYHDVDPGERKISAATPKRWNVFILEITGQKPAQNRACCPETCRVLENVPNMIQAFFSILDPGKSVPQHEGPYFGYLRYHLGVRVPALNPPELVVNSQRYVWKEGEAVLFDDSWPHSVNNQSKELRAVLIVDVRRPMPLIADLCNRFITDVIARRTYGRAVARRAEAFATARLAQRRIAA